MTKRDGVSGDDTRGSSGRNRRVSRISESDKLMTGIRNRDYSILRLFFSHKSSIPPFGGLVN